MGGGVGRGAGVEVEVTRNGRSVVVWLACFACWNEATASETFEGKTIRER